MSRYVFRVTLETDTIKHAWQVMSERLEYDEPYRDEDGIEFDYQFRGYQEITTTGD